MFMVVIRLYAFQFFSNWNLSIRYTKCVESKSGFHLVFGMRFWLAFVGPEISWPVLARIWKYFNISISCMIWIDFFFFFTWNWTAQTLYGLWIFQGITVRRVCGFIPDPSLPCSLPHHLAGLLLWLHLSLGERGSSAPSTISYINPSLMI